MQIHRITARQALNHVGGDPYDYGLNIYRGAARTGAGTALPSTPRSS